MKKIAFLIVLFSLCSTMKAQEIINFFEVAENIAKPVTIKTNLGTFKIYGGEKISGTIYSLTAYDANGNKIVQNSYYKSEWNSSHTYHYRYYRFKDVYSSSSQSSQSESNSGYRPNRTAQEVGNQLGNSLARGMGVDIDGTPNLQVRGGWAWRYGEYVSLKTELGGMAGLVFAGGYGKDLINEGWSSEDVSWFAELSAYISSDEDGYDSFSFGLLYASTLGYDEILGVQFEYSHFFEDAPRLGYFINGFWGVLHSTDRLCFNVGAGLSIKLLSR